MMHDPIADCFSAINNAEKAGKKDIVIRHGSNSIRNILKIMKENDYLADFKEEKTYNDVVFHLTLKGNINKCRIIKPRMPVKKNEYIKYEKQYLPAVDVGHLIVSTPKGIVSHKTVLGKEGGVLMGFIY
ncbi:MAG: 30S ribosomal protein S8 [Candidatus Aenigmarchaeota archaeon]|nr:30S ribosomal protein S8 [Candidatus Aenigmarchaeota archaeon]